MPEVPKAEAGDSEARVATCAPPGDAMHYNIPSPSGGVVNRARPTRMKREREKARKERQQQKTARRAEAKVRKAERQVTPGEDPDIAGIRPGPQPSPWGDEEEAEEEEEEPES